MIPSDIEARVRALSHDLNKFRERRLADRRFQPRASADRRHLSEARTDKDNAEPAKDNNK